MSASPDALGRVDDAVVALHTAVAARAVYWPEHRSVRARLQLAFDIFSAHLEQHGHLSIMLLPDRVVVSGRELPSSSRLALSLGRRARERGIECITLSRGLGLDELTRLAEVIGAKSNAAPEGPPVFAHARLEGLATRSGAATRPDTARPHADDAPPVSALADSDEGRRSVQGLHSILGGTAAPHDSANGCIEAAVASVLGLLAACRGAVLPLAALKSHDEYTYVHASNVAVLAGALAETIGLSSAIVRDITVGALMHDVGKERIPAWVINKTGKLDDREMGFIRQHPVDGARMLAAVDGIPPLALIIAYEHHIHLDGTGYPHLAPGKTTHLASRIVQLADVYDALGTHRPYRAALKPAEICSIMSKRSGTAYDAALLNVFLNSVIARIEKPAERPAPISNTSAAA